ncbi:hypothetical protein [Kibdelosporangium philippinense]|uniref:hypothetical protein n=1 Tax=Kibdelosporangium philippinense TaxID=211113 RepID=UPI00361242B9
MSRFVRSVVLDRSRWQNSDRDTTSGQVELTLAPETVPSSTGRREQSVVMPVDRHTKVFPVVGPTVGADWKLS